MDIQNNSIVTDADTDVLDSQITQISNDFAETYYFDNEQQEELEMLVAKCMKLGELYERKKWQAAKAQAVPEGFVLVPKKPDVDKAWDIALKRIVPPPKTNDAIQQELMCKKYVDDLCSEQDRILLDYEAMIEAQEPTND